MAVTEVEHTSAFTEISDGYLKILLTEREAGADKIQFILESAYQGLNSIAHENKRFAKMEVKNV